MSFWKPRRKNRLTPVIKQPVHPTGTIVSIGDRDFVAIRTDYTQDHMVLTFESVTAFNRRLRIDRAPLN